MSDPITDFEQACAAAGVTPAAALKAGGVHPTMWWRWRSGKVSPTLKKLDAAKAGLAALAERRSAA